MNEKQRYRREIKARINSEPCLNRKYRDILIASNVADEFQKNLIQSGIKVGPIDKEVATQTDLIPLLESDQFDKVEQIIQKWLRGK